MGGTVYCMGAKPEAQARSCPSSRLPAGGARARARRVTRVQSPAGRGEGRAREPGRWSAATVTPRDGLTDGRSAGPLRAMVEHVTRSCCLGWDFSTQQVPSQDPIACGAGPSPPRRRAGWLAPGAGIPGPSRGCAALLSSPGLKRPLPDAWPMPCQRVELQTPAFPETAGAPRRDPTGT